MPLIDTQSVGCECLEGYLYHTLFTSIEGRRRASNPSPVDFSTSGQA